MRKNSVHYLLLFASLMILGCNNKYVDNIDRGANYYYRPGFPELRVASIGYVDQNNRTFIVVSGEVVEGSLIYSKKEDVYAAQVSIEINIFDTETEELVKNDLIDKELTSITLNIINSQDLARFEEEYELPAGKYKIESIITDLRSNKQTIITNETILPNPIEDFTHLTEIRVLGKDSFNDERFHPITGFNIGQANDSLRFTFQVTNNDADNPITVRTRLLKFRSDTTASRSMTAINYNPATIQYRGIELDKYNELQSSRRVLLDPGSVFIELNYSDLTIGNYRLEIFANQENGEELYRARDFGIRSKNYPTLGTPRELALPLTYLMERKEYQRLIGAASPEALKREVDTFWLRNIQNSNIAKQTIEQYYQRVEEANKQFSTYKEGWKTDPGMIYILFGPPIYVTRNVDVMHWGYSYNLNDPETNFYFRIPRLNSKYYPFDNFVLERSPQYHNIQYQQIQLWLNGKVR